jgi:hypothetical protein
VDLARLRHPPSELADLNQTTAVAAELNTRPGTSRPLRLSFQALDQPALKPLPENLEFAVWKKPASTSDYHVEFDKHSAVSHTSSTRGVRPRHQSPSDLFNNRRCFPSQSQPPGRHTLWTYAPASVSGVVTAARALGETIGPYAGRQALLNSVGIPASLRSCLGLLRLGNRYSEGLGRCAEPFWLAFTPTRVSRTS